MPPTLALNKAVMLALPTLVYPDIVVDLEEVQPMLTDYAEHFAALVAVCGWVVPPKQIADLDPSTTPAGVNAYVAMATGLKSLPVRLYHGSLDTIVPPAESRRLALALHDLGADAKYNEFADVGHAAWEKAFADPELWSWLFSKRRTAPVPQATATP